MRVKSEPQAPRDVITKLWQRHVLYEDGSIDPRAYTFCVLDGLRKALRRQDVFASPSWRYGRQSPPGYQKLICRNSC